MARVNERVRAEADRLSQAAQRDGTAAHLGSLAGPATEFKQTEGAMRLSVAGACVVETGVSVAAAGSSLLDSPARSMAQ